MDTVDMLNKR